MKNLSNPEDASTRIYGAYGGHPCSLRSSRTAYAGQIAESDTGWYLLGERPYSPSLRRFMAPDPLSPFENGGLNRHAYCNGDPINYVDPSGHVKRPWQINRPTSGLAGTSSRSPAPDVPGTSSTPAMTTVRESAMPSASSPSAGVLTGSLAVPSDPGNAILGSLSLGADTASRSVATLPKKRRTAEATHTVADANATERRRRRVDILSGEAIPASRLAPNRTGTGLTLSQSWVSRSPPGKPHIKIWGADTMVTGSHLVSVFDRAQKMGIKKLTLYTGADGLPTGENWNVRTGERLYGDVRHAADDLGTVWAKAANYGLEIDTINMALMTRDGMKALLLREGPRVNVLNYCFSSVDEVVMEVLGIRHGTVYEDRTQLL